MSFLSNPVSSLRIHPFHPSSSPLTHHTATYFTMGELDSVLSFASSCTTSPPAIAFLVVPAVVLQEVDEPITDNAGRMPHASMHWMALAPLDLETHGPIHHHALPFGSTMHLHDHFHSLISASSNHRRRGRHTIDAAVIAFDVQ